MWPRCMSGSQRRAGVQGYLAECWIEDSPLQSEDAEHYDNVKHCSTGNSELRVAIGPCICYAAFVRERLFQLCQSLVLLYMCSMLVEGTYMKVVGG